MSGLDASLIKERILSFIQQKGPSLPVQIAKSVNISPLFASAFLSELYGEQKLKMSNLKVGSSFLYHLEGQEPQLENFVEFLNHKEKEAFHLLKREKILEDEKQEPAIRVALRSIKDFAHPRKIASNNEEKIIWKYFLVNEDEISKNLNKVIQIEKKEEKIVEKEDIPTINLPENKSEKINVIEKVIENKIETEEKIKVKKKVKQEDAAFQNSVKEYLKSRDIEFLSLISEKKKELTAKVRIDTPLGKQEFLLTAKEKKKATEEDLALAFQKAQLEKMPALLMTTGEIDKKSIDEFKSWANLVKFDRLKI
jgi:hypothetical protein